MLAGFGGQDRAAGMPSSGAGTSISLASGRPSMRRKSASARSSSRSQRSPALWRRRLEMPRSCWRRPGAGRMAGGCRAGGRQVEWLAVVEPAGGARGAATAKGRRSDRRPADVCRAGRGAPVGTTAPSAMVLGCARPASAGPSAAAWPAAAAPLLLLAIAVLGGALRLYRYDALSLWLDELSTLWLASLPWPTVL